MIEATYCENKMPSDGENGVFEIESVVQVVVVQDHGGTENHPDRNDHRGRKLRLGGCRCASSGGLGQSILVFLSCTRQRNADFLALVDRHRIGIHNKPENRVSDPVGLGWVSYTPTSVKVVLSWPNRISCVKAAAKATAEPSTSRDQAFKSLNQ